MPGVKRIQIEGAGGSDWVLIDAGDIIVHLFKPDARALYAPGEDVERTEFDDDRERRRADRTKAVRRRGSAAAPARVPLATDRHRPA